MVYRNPDFVKVVITFERFADGWLFPQIDIEGADSFEDYERISESYELLGQLLLRLAAHRQLRRGRSQQRRQRALAQAADQLLRARWVQLTLEEEL